MSPIDPPIVEAPGSRPERVRASVGGWARELAGVGGRNTLLMYRDLSVGTLDLTHAHPSGLAMLLAGRPTRLSTLVREAASLADARRRARAIRAKTVELAEERGIEAGWLAVGMATWSTTDPYRPPAAPVLLRPCGLRPRGVVGEDFDVDIGPVAELNPALVHHLSTEFGLHLDAEVIAELATTENGFDPGPVLERIAQTCRDVPGFRVAHRLVISTFSYARLPMIADLQAQRESLADHDVVAAMAGDPQALVNVAGRPLVLSPAKSDPYLEHVVLDADSSQQAVLEAVLAGSHLVVKGPPGTGKSQTIANLVAILAAAGRRTLFVAEKRVAIDAVLSRLAGIGLADLVLDLHDGASNRCRVAHEIARSLDLASRALSPDELDPSAGAASILAERREQLRGHVEALHQIREPWGVSAHDAQNDLARLTDRRPAPRSRVRVRGAALAALDGALLATLHEELREAATLGAFHAGPEDDPWFGAHLTSVEETAEALSQVTRLSEQTLPQARYTMDQLLTEVGMEPSQTVAGWGAALSLASSVRATLETFSAQVFDTSLSDVVAATATNQWRVEQGVVMGWRQRQQLVRQARRLLRPGRPPADLHEVLALAHEQRQAWQQCAGPGSRPQLPAGLDAAERAYLDVVEPLAWLAERLADTPGGPHLVQTDLEVLSARLQMMVERTSSLPVIPRTVQLRERLRAAGLELLLTDLANRDVMPQDVGSELDLVWWTSVLEHIAVTDPRYGAHDGGMLRESAVEFAAADRAYVAGGAARVRRVTTQRLVDALHRHPAQAALLRAEAAKVRRHRPLRDVAGRCPDVLFATRPCWAMSPLMVSQALPAGQLFDVVIFDEASQVAPAVAVAAMSRGRQVVVVGDEHQLPPTAFFTSAVLDDAVQETDPGVTQETQSAESVLDVLAEMLPVVQLRWHYRSRDERLIEFANRRVYGGALVTFPGAQTGPVLQFEEVDGRGVLSPDAEAVESTDAEVSRVVELVVEHARQRPHESLGVIALGLHHARRVDDALRRELGAHPEVADFFAEDRPERFVVKSLERVQGDERDAIILSIGYGRTPHGRVLHRFGALNQAGGEQRLNVAITRARSRMTVVAAFGPSDLDPARLSAPGARLLRDYLDYVGAGGAMAQESDPPAADPLLVDLARRLRAQGLQVHPGYGASGTKIDLAVGPDGGALCVAVESDGPQYAGVDSTRERDRLRPEQLERLGWRHLRAWSTDIFRDPAREVARISVAVGKAAPAAPASPPRRPLGGARQQIDLTVAGLEDRFSRPQRVGPQPPVPTGLPIEEYTPQELDDVLRWICSDKRPRTPEALATLTHEVLRVSRPGARVEPSIQRAIARVLAADTDSPSSAGTSRPAGGAA